MSPFSRFRETSDDNWRRGCESDASLSKTAASYERQRNDADADLREKQAYERDSDDRDF
ncbi:MAG: hypothetical protein AAGE59_31305 [Cyanobacteria bacterium P01_F01_bin.86]